VCESPGAKGQSAEQPFGLRRAAMAEVHDREWCLIVVDHKHIFITRIHPTNGSFSDGASFSEAGASPPNYSNCGARLLSNNAAMLAMLMSDEDADLVLLEDDVILGEVVMSESTTFPAAPLVRPPVLIYPVMFPPVLSHTTMELTAETLPRHTDHGGEPASDSTWYA